MIIDIRVTIVFVIFLLSLSLCARLSTSLVDIVQYDDSIVSNVVNLANGRYASLAGLPSRVFSVNNEAIEFEQSLTGSGTYKQALSKGNVFYAITKGSLIDIIWYDEANGLSLTSTIDVSLNPDDFTVIRKAYIAGNSIILDIVCESENGSISINRCLYDVTNSLHPVLRDVAQIRPDDILVGFYHYSFGFLFIKANGQVFSSNIATLYPSNLIYQLTNSQGISYAQRIGDKLFIVPSYTGSNQQVYYFSIINEILLLSTTNVGYSNILSITSNSESRIYISGYSSDTNAWKVALYNLTENNDLILSNQYMTNDGFYYDVIHAENKVILTRPYKTIQTSINLVFEVVLNEAVDYVLEDVLLDRYIIMSSTDNRCVVYDIIERAVIATYNGMYDDNLKHEYQDSFVVLSDQITLVKLGENGIEQEISTIYPDLVLNGIDVRENSIVMVGYSSGVWEIQFYRISDNNIIFVGDTYTRYSIRDVFFYDDNHIIVVEGGSSDLGICHVYRLSNDTNLISLGEITTNTFEPFIINNELVFYNDSITVYDFSNPDMLTETGSYPSQGGSSSTISFNDSHFMINRNYTFGLIYNNNYQYIDYVFGTNCLFISENRFISRASCGFAIYEIDAFSSGFDDIMPPEVSCKSYPNPFNTSTVISLTKSSSEPALISIYNFRGQCVLSDSFTRDNESEFKYTWNGCDARGNSVSSGVYIVKIQFKDTNHSFRILRIKQ